MPIFSFTTVLLFSIEWSEGNILENFTNLQYFFQVHFPLLLNIHYQYGPNLQTQHLLIQEMKILSKDLVFMINQSLIVHSEKTWGWKKSQIPVVAVKDFNQVWLRTECATHSMVNIPLKSGKIQKSCQRFRNSSHHNQQATKLLVAQDLFKVYHKANNILLTEVMLQ